MHYIISIFILSCTGSIWAIKFHWLDRFLLYMVTDQYIILQVNFIITDNVCTVYCVYPAMSKSPKQLSSYLRIAEMSVVLIVFNGVLWLLHLYCYRFLNVYIVYTLTKCDNLLTFRKVCYSMYIWYEQFLFPDLKHQRILILTLSHTQCQFKKKPTFSVFMVLIFHIIIHPKKK
jgi:hypothetical protein